ncbi:MAG TPA: sodium-dependent transporter [Cyclobacteriaceae bacterium]|nr:sodium-dependent transporter [Cyclobacteriaceae bacterium]
MDGSSRGEFSSSFGFVMAAAGSAIGLGNIWGFPTQTAQNGGAAFVLLYLVLAFVVGYPILLAEFTIGRHTQSNPVGAYQSIKGGKRFAPIGFLGITTVGFILSFYSIIAGTMMAYFLSPILKLVGLNQAAAWVISQGVSSNILFASIFFFITVLIVAAGVKNGIEKWSSRLMPTLLLILILLTIYVLTLDGAMEGLKVYLLPDFTKVLHTQLFTSALGQAFFSLSLGVGSMLVLASYTSKKENLVRLGRLVTLSDVGIAFLAGLLIIPSMYAASASGAQIFDETGSLISGPNLIFQVLPALFDTMGPIGIGLATVFFFLMVIAALTSTISMLEVPVAYAVDNRGMNRTKASIIIGVFFWVVSMIIVLNFDLLFDFVVSATTQFIQPLLGLFICIFVGWVMNRNTLIEEIKQGNPDVENSFFMKIWPLFIRYVSPILILIILAQAFL